MLPDAAAWCLMLLLSRMVQSSPACCLVLRTRLASSSNVAIDAFIVVIHVAAG